MKNYKVLIKSDDGLGDLLQNSITVKADCLLEAYDIALDVITLFSDDFSYTIWKIFEI